MELKPGPCSTMSHFRAEAEGLWRHYDDRMTHAEETPPTSYFHKNVCRRAAIGAVVVSSFLQNERATGTK